MNGRSGDRRLTMANFIRANGSVFEDVQSRRLVWEDEEINGRDDVQYLGEHMVCGILLIDEL